MTDTSDKFQKQILEHWGLLAGLEKIQRIVEGRISDTRELIRALANFLDDKERTIELMLLDVYKHPTNISEAVRVALYVAKMNDERLTPVQIKERAEVRGFGFNDYTNPMASIHTVLKRMRDGENPEVDFREDDGTYLLNNPPTLAPELMEAFHKRFWVQLASVQQVDEQKTEQISAQVYDEVFGKAFEKTRRKRLED